MSNLKLPSIFLYFHFGWTMVKKSPLKWSIWPQNVHIGQTCRKVTFWLQKTVPNFRILTRRRQRTGPSTGLGFMRWGFLVLGSWFLVLGAWYLVPSSLLNPCSAFRELVEVRDLIPYRDMFLPGCVGEGGWHTGESSSGAVRYTPLPWENEGTYYEKLTQSIPKTYLKHT